MERRDSNENIATKKGEKKERDFKSSTTSTILLNSTINAPNVKLLIKAVATLLHSNLLEDLQDGKTISPKSDLYYFTEEKYIAENPEMFDEERINLLRKTPTQEDISGFIEVSIKSIIYRHCMTWPNLVLNAALYALSILIEL
jgi:hypothetical protein